MGTKVAQARFAYFGSDLVTRKLKVKVTLPSRYPPSPKWLKQVNWNTLKEC